MKVVIDGVEYVPAPSPGKPRPMHALFAEARQLSRKTLKEISAETDMHLSKVYNAESGGHITLLTAIKLCRCYGINLETLAKSVEFEEFKK